jgi:hypothetical protein
MRISEDTKKVWGQVQRQFSELRNLVKDDLREEQYRKVVAVDEFEHGVAKGDFRELQKGEV